MDIEVDYEKLPNHIAIIMDGNRRWAKQNGLSVKDGHKEGAENLKRIAKFANKIDIKYMTVYAFSTENWKRTKEEVGALMLLLQSYIESFLKSVKEYNIKIQVIGHIEGLNNNLINSIKKIEEKTKDNTGLTLNIAFNYGGRDEIVRAVRKISEKVKDEELRVEDINEEVFSNHLYTRGQPDPDLLIRTSGELRTSNFLPWQLVYSEFYFTQKYWPEFSEDDLLLAIAEYQKRNRKFGAK